MLVQADRKQQILLTIGMHDIQSHITQVKKRARDRNLRKLHRSFKPPSCRAMLCFRQLIGPDLEEQVQQFLSGVGIEIRIDIDFGVPMFGKVKSVSFPLLVKARNHSHKES